MTYLSLQREIEQASKKKVKLKINDNRSTMLSVKWEPDCTKVSMHRLFLEAPKNIMDALTCHIGHKNSNVAPSVKAYIEDKLKNLDYSDTLDKEKLVTKGTYYDLLELYNAIEDEYFPEEELNLNITWFGSKQMKRRSRLTFGLYHQPLRLVKINKMMDSERFPPFFVEYVIFHEMLHHLCPSYYDGSGKLSVHTREFKAREKEFKYYGEAKKWLKANTLKLFEQC